MFTIYGDYLRPGHCEVHPFVHEPYPCSVCVSEADRDESLKAEYEADMRDLYECEMRELFEADMESAGFDPIKLGI